MEKIPKLERIFIAPKCREVKDRFPTRQSVEVVIPEIFNHIEETGETHTCRHHTHTKPPLGASVVFIREFKLPDRFLQVKRFVPCPCCWDEIGKFGRGMIAWFPDEKVIRIVGRRCFRSLNPEGFDRAAREFDAEKKRREDTLFLLSKLPQVPKLATQISVAIQIAEAVEEFHRNLHSRMTIFGVDFWPHVRNGGELRLSQRQREFVRTDQGEMRVREVEVSQVAFRLQGFKMLDADRKQLSSPLRLVQGELKALEFSDPAARVSKMNGEEKHVCAKTLGMILKKAHHQIERIEELRKFVDPIAINTLRNWIASAGSPISFTIRHEASKLTVGRYETATLTVEIPNILTDPTTLLSIV